MSPGPNKRNNSDDDATAPRAREQRSVTQLEKYPRARFAFEQVA